MFGNAKNLLDLFESIFDPWYLIFSQNSTCMHVSELEIRWHFLHVYVIFFTLHPPKTKCSFANLCIILLNVHDA